MRITQGLLFHAALGKTRKLGLGRMSRVDVWYMVRRRAANAGIETAIGCHTFHAQPASRTTDERWAH